VADKDDDLHDVVSGLADRYKLKGKDRDKFIHEHMTAGGYRAVPNYVPADKDDDDDDSGPRWVGRSRRSRSRRRDDDDDDW
jgi:hypothetical protein